MLVKIALRMLIYRLIFFTQPTKVIVFANFIHLQKAIFYELIDNPKFIIFVLVHVWIWIITQLYNRIISGVETGF